MFTGQSFLFWNPQIKMHLNSFKNNTTDKEGEALNITKYYKSWYFLGHKFNFSWYILQDTCFYTNAHMWNIHNNPEVNQLNKFRF